ncbi:hypothetical protein VTJ49DRAFT_3339 [Mycothermus thermophilus]|uniref:Uncharacterized protein n=1 Tax=Humicola insolens TaxID=85995 RepID=A0ABR3VNL7_HUMIN
MAASPIVIFQALASGQQPSGATVEGLKQQDGFRRALFGIKMEDPDTGILCTGEFRPHLPRPFRRILLTPFAEWSSLEAARSFSASQTATSLAAKETLGFVAAGGKQQDLLSVTSAPCTEIFTAFGAEEGFVANVGRFVAAVDANQPEGYKGASYAQSIDLATESSTQQETVLRVLIGWTSREAHIEAKAKPGAIQDNIHELRALRKSVDLFHVEFKEL